MPYAPCRDAAIYYETHGAGPPLLLVAGLASDSQSWASVLAPLATRFTVLVFDHRGVGRTRAPAGPVDVATMADDAVALLAHLGHARAHVLGHSMGGMVALDLALRHPAAVDRLLLCATAAANPPRNDLLFANWADLQDAPVDPALFLRNLLFWILTPRFFADAAAVDAAVRYGLEYPYPQPPAAFRRQVEAIAAFDAAPRLAELRVPVLLVAGAEDALFPPALMDDLARALPGARRATIPAAAHSIHLEAPAAFVAEVAAFLGR